MKRNILLFIVLVIGVTVCSNAYAGTYVINPDTAIVRFRIKHLGGYTTGVGRLV